MGLDEKLVEELSSKHFEKLVYGIGEDIQKAGVQEDLQIHTHCCTLSLITSSIIHNIYLRLKTKDPELARKWLGGVFVAITKSLDEHGVQIDFKVMIKEGDPHG